MHKDIEISNSSLKDIEDFVGKRISGVDILEYALLGLSSLNSSGDTFVDTLYTDLTKCILPIYEDLFQVIKGKNLSLVKMPMQDYSIYNFNKVNIKGTIFHKKATIIPKRNIFQEIYGKDLTGTSLPSGDYNNVDFNGVILKNTSFPMGSILPKEEDFLQNLRGKRIDGAKFQSGDLSNWNFKDILIERAFFGKNVKLPKDKDLFRNVKDSSIYGCIFINQDLSIYDFKGVDVSFCEFIDCKLPFEYNWVSEVKSKAILSCRFVNVDLSSQDFSEVNISCSKFLGKTKLNITKDFFINLHHRQALGLFMPRYDYSHCIFDEVDLSQTTFDKRSILPEYDFVSKLFCCTGLELSDNLTKYLHYYDIKGTGLDITRNYKDLTKYQRVVISSKMNGF